MGKSFGENHCSWQLARGYNSVLVLLDKTTAFISISNGIGYTSINVLTLASSLWGVGKSHCHVFLGGLDPGQAPLKTLLLMLRLT